MRYKVVVSFLITAILVLGLAAQASSAIIRVKFDSPNNGPGNDWDHAYQTVTTGLAAAVSGDEVWVAKGTYVGCITLKLGVALYGGFVGTETERDQRDWKTNVTILDGNHSGSVVRSPTDATSTTRVDGFTIRNGSGVDGDGLGTCGGGVYCPSSSPTIANNTITHNDVNKYGGGIYCSSGSPVIVDNRICENKVAVANWGVGGGVYCENCTVTICGNEISGNGLYWLNPGVLTAGGGVAVRDSSGTIADNIMQTNSAGDGAGVYCWRSSVLITKNRVAESNGVGIWCQSSPAPTIAANDVACNYGTGVYCGGSSPVITNNRITGNCGTGVRCVQCSPQITNNTITVNYAENGGGIECEDSSPTISNNIVAFNSSGVYKSGTGAPALRNNDVYANTDYNYSGLSSGVGDMSTDPGFVSMDYGNVHIRPSSACVNAGWDQAPGLPSTDLDGQPRKQGAAVDIGADESDGSSPPAGPYAVVRVSLDGDDLNDGSTWALAKKSIRSAIDAVAPVGGEVWVKAGTYSEVIDLYLHAYLYGGFAGTEGSKSQRDWVSNRTVIDGFTVTAFFGLGYGGCALDGFTIGFGGGQGIRCSHSSPFIANNIITLRTGSGIECSDASPILVNNRLLANSSEGIVCHSSCPVVSNNTIVGNLVGIRVYGSAPLLSNNVIAFNRLGGVCSDSGGEPVMRNNDVYGNTSYDYSGLTAGDGDISLDPLFVNRTDGDYHLLLGSPCINVGWDDVTGIPELDMDGQARKNGTIDMGADEYYPTPMHMGSAKTASDGAVQFGSCSVVSASFPDYLYIESPDRTCGIRVEKTAHGLSVGAVTDLAGTVQTNSDGERYIAASAIVQIGAGNISPLAMNNLWLGGGPFGLQGGMSSSIGLNNIGLLVRTSGRFTKTSDTTFTLDDGSGVNVKCVVPDGVTLDPAWTYACVTGVSSCEKIGDELHRLIRVRTQSDIVGY